MYLSKQEGNVPLTHLGSSSCLLTTSFNSLFQVSSYGESFCSATLGNEFVFSSLRLKSLVPVMYLNEENVNQ